MPKRPPDLRSGAVQACANAPGKNAQAIWQNVFKPIPLRAPCSALAKCTAYPLKNFGIRFLTSAIVIYLLGLNNDSSPPGIDPRASCGVTVHLHGAARWIDFEGGKK
ncbi:MAG: hypothetical protein VB087_12755 [Candidatus Limiplasma sp.]|nr:hypothetical protein [Candidatus Limiplasma sp.]MEA5146644.1 hypothetical protein [Candidatus Limiplasma sp.]